VALAGAPSRDTLLRTEEPIIQNGYIQVPETPEIGAELNEEVAREYLRPDSPFFE
jgi:L-alanine-DL-glutamate epimerase-like enolase superfamily enzyme